MLPLFQPHVCPSNFESVERCSNQLLTRKTGRNQNLGESRVDHHFRAAVRMKPDAVTTKTTEVQSWLMRKAGAELLVILWRSGTTPVGFSESRNWLIVQKRETRSLRFFLAEVLSSARLTLTLISFLSPTGLAPKLKSVLSRSSAVAA